MEIQLLQYFIHVLKPACLKRTGSIATEKKCRYQYFRRSMSSLPASIKRIGSKRKIDKKWRHHFPHYKSVGVFLEVQGQITPQQMVQSGQNSNSSKICMSSSIFRRSSAANSLVSGGIWSNFKLIQAFMHVLITCNGC